MAVRVASAAIGIPLFIGLALWGPAQFGLGVLAISTLGLIELVRACRRKGIRANPIVAALGLLGPFWIMVIAPYGPPIYGGFLPSLSDNLLALVLIPLIVALVGEVVEATRTGELSVARNLAYGLLCAMYVSLFAGMTALRNLPGSVRSGTFPGMEVGTSALLLTVFCVWVTDSFAYFAGRMFGSRKLAPAVSPNKTVEGSIGGLVAALIAGPLIAKLLVNDPVIGLAIGAITGMLGQLGDLFESAIKRELETKDLGTLMPGHGGVMDRFDSILFAAPVSAALLSWLQPTW